MAPTEQRMKTQKFKPNKGNWKKPPHTARGVQKKKNWKREHKVFEGSVREGQGFAFKRKEKVRHEYNKILRKEKKKPELDRLYEEKYPEHLQHLYEAEAQRERKEDWEHRVNRRKQRLAEPARHAEESNDEAEPAEAAEAAEAAEEGAAEGLEQTDSNPVRESLPISNRMRKRMQKKTSYQKTKEAFEQAREKRRKKKEEYLKNKQQREEAIQRYKQKKMEVFQMLSKKTKKGQPNLNLQMEYLLQKIQKSKE